MLQFVKILLDITVKDRILRVEFGYDPYKEVVLKMWFSDHQHWHHLWAYQKWEFMGHDLLTQHVWEWDTGNV